jgi:hypothetical protein
MKKTLSSITFWLIVFAAIIVIEGVSAFAQEADLFGKWQSGSVGSMGYQNQVTGATKYGRSHIFSYKFLPNGSYEFIGYMETSMYNCDNTLFNQITGRYSINGDTIDLNPSRDFWKSTNSCAASGNKQTTKTPTPKTIGYRFKTDDYGQKLLCIAEGEVESCYQRSKN